MSKLNLHSTAKLVAYAVRNKIIRVQFPTVALPSRGGNRSADVTSQSPS